jgi:uncharacterized protein (DUF2147 family)
MNRLSLLPQRGGWLASLTLACAVLSSPFAAAQPSPVGLWQSFDNTTGAPRAELRITESMGVLTARIERNLLTTTTTTTSTTSTPQVCSLCTDDRKGVPLIGMALVRNAKASADPTVWEGGEILDPDEGKTYRLRLQLFEDGKKLQVRGYIGPFFKNRVWVRLP